MSQARELDVAIDTLRANLMIIVNMGAEAVLGRISLKLLDVITAVSTAHIESAVDDLWACSAFIQRGLYLGLTERLGRKSSRYEVADQSYTAGKYRSAHDGYKDANREIAVGSDFETIFED